MKEEKVIEPEIVKDGEENFNSKKDGFDSFDGFTKTAAEFAESEFKGIKNKIILQALLYIFIVGTILILVIWAIVWLLSLILPPLFVVFLVVFVLAILGYPIYWIVQKFKK